MELLQHPERLESTPGCPTDLPGSGRNRRDRERGGRRMPWVVSCLVLMIVGCVLVSRWLFLSDRGWSSTTAYFDPWYQDALPLALILLVCVLPSVGNWRGVRIPRWVVTTVRYVSILVVTVTVAVVLVVPFVIWFVEAVVVPIVMAWLYINRRRIERGQLPRLPRTPRGWLSVADTAAQIRPHV